MTTLALIGNNDGPLRLLEGLAVRGGHPLAAVLLQKLPDDLRDRYRTLGVEPLHTPDEASALAALSDRKFDLLVNCFANFRFRELHHRYPTLNVHPSPLPRYRGRHPIRWALINGETEYGISVHRMSDGWDAGEIVWQRLVDVTPGESARELRNRLLDLLADDFGQFLQDLEQGRHQRIANDPARATYVTRRRPADGTLTDWTDRDRIWRTVRALRHDDHPARLRVAGESYLVRDAERTARHFVGFVTGTVVGGGGDRPEIVCADGRTVRLYLDRSAPLRLNDRLD